MKIQTIPTINFKSDYYGFRKEGSNYFVTSIKTDDLPEQGKNLILHCSYYSNKQNELVEKDIPMIQDGKFYTGFIERTNRKIKYNILNKEKPDTEKTIEPWDFYENLSIYNRLSIGKPLEQVVLEGSTQGIVVTDIDNIPKDKPTIVILDEFRNNDNDIQKLISIATTVKGVVVANSELVILSHAVQLMKDYFDVVSIVWDKEKINKLKSLNGEKVFLSNKNGLLKFSNIEKFSRPEEIKPPKINIPILEPEERLLDFSELTRENSGEKAYRLGVMQKLIKEGYLQDIEVPPGFVIPLGYLNKISEYLKNSSAWNEDNPFSSAIADKFKEYEINERAILRSAFNAEDLSDYPTAGIYDSFQIDTMASDLLLYYISCILHSKDGESATLSRQKFGISDDVIQPTIIAQKYIKTDPSFTLYTNYDDDKLLIEMFDRKLGYAQYKNPARIIYDRKSGDIKLDPPCIYANYLVKDTGEIVEENLEEDSIVKIWQNMLAPIKTAIENALKLEKYFGRPQDIEGGIKNGRVYFWQARGIGKKTIRR